MIFNADIPITVSSVKEFRENKNFYETICSEDQTYFVDDSMIMTHTELINMEQHTIIVNDPDTAF
jgi:hypothetical protein